MSRSRTNLPPEHCANCGVSVSRRGPKPASGKRYCMDPECQGVRNSETYTARRPSALDGWAPAECACCKDPLKKRKKRRGDSPTGLRWCKKLRCQENRVGTESAYNVGALQTKIENLAGLVEFYRLWTLADFTPCPECGQPRAIEGYQHANLAAAGALCTNDGAWVKQVNRLAAVACWPGSF